VSRPSFFRSAAWLLQPTCKRRRIPSRPLILEPTRGLFHSGLFATLLREWDTLSLYRIFELIFSALPCRCYIVGDVDRTDPLLSPFHAATSDFPSTVYLTTGTGDTLYWDSKNLVNRLTAEGHPSAIFRPAVGMGHAPGLFRPDDPTNLPLLMYTDIVNNIRKSWSQPRGRRESKM
jgi:acetyl esterase/lipase